ncbi:MAG: hypothetical protein ASARMPRED_004164 [Alectoria sarmentosa]|nr:MAG: hypothetical protein ASARMPRED_004164 [Alectoria sarmentosa]
MSSTQSPKIPRVRQARKSIAHTPSADITGNKENATVGTGAIASFGAQGKQAAKKNRSKSIGPGGLDALKDGSGNKQEPSLPPYVKSILKPTITLSPPKVIPPHNPARNGSPGKANGRQKPETSPRKSPAKKPADSATQGLPNPFEASPKPRSPARSPTRIAVRSEEEQQAAAKERERQEILANRDARRKSLANRRVSFAPEATLHTWNVVEVPEDSTTSSASTNSTRRASALTANAGSPYTAPRSPMPSSDASEPPSTPPEQVEEVQVAASPAHQRDLHQRKRRRSSGIPPMNFNNPDEFSSSPYSGASDDTGTQTFVTADEDSDSSSSNDNDLVQDETVTGVDGDDNTIHSTSGSSTESSGRLEAALRQAANQAGTQGIDYDEHGDITMEMADDEITAAFKPWVKKGNYVPQVVGDPSALQDQENLNPFSPAFKANVDKRDEEDGTMEMTQAVGRILPATEETQVSPKRRKQKSVTNNNRRRSSAGRRRSSGDGSALGDETMDLTTAIGVIEQKQTSAQSEDKFDQSGDEDEELTMEFTSVIGGVLQPISEHVSSTDDSLVNRQLFQDVNRRESMESSNNEEDMDITFAAGGILPSITERTEPIEDQTQGMDMDITTAVGAILPVQPSTGNKTEAKILMEQETDVGQLSGSPFFGTPRQKPIGVGLSDERALPALRATLPEPLSTGNKTQAKSLMEQETNVGHLLGAPIFGTPRQKPVGVGLSDERVLPAHARAMASESGSPSLMSSQTRSQPRRMIGRQSVTPKVHHPTPVKEPNTPSKQSTPQMMRPTTPGKTPPSKNVTMRTASPKKLFKTEIKEANNAPDSNPRRDAPNPLFSKDLVTGAETPSIVLKPRRRRSSGLGADREGLGSPRVTALLDRRRSISDDSKAFISHGHSQAGVRFEDPQVMEQELDQERAEDERRESGRGILQEEADTQDLEEKDHTANLKDMIERLTPQKKKLNGRKSLHVGAAKGLLGKRPAELDDDEDEDGTPKRLKGREGSPIKKAKLPAPPPKTATTGRMTRSSRLSLVEIAGNARASTPSGSISPLKTDTTPKDQPRFKDVEARSLAKVQSFEHKLDASTTDTAEPTEQEDRIHLQDFLNMTSIRFIELTTTKRRHTVVPNALPEQSTKQASLGGNDADDANAGNELESCVVAGACTVPMLELYQHSCRELKSYISEGRSIVKEIEADTYEENPPLFREYMSAPPDLKPIMDNQFKNVKTHARLLSKAMWYEWRMKLLDGLKEGLLKIGEGMEEDDRLLTQQEQIIQPVLPAVIEEHETLEKQVSIAQAQAAELADCDQDELKEARDSLMSIERDLEAKQKLVEDLQSQLREREDGLADVIDRKQECIDEIKEAEKIRSDCRGWSSTEVSALHGRFPFKPRIRDLLTLSANVTALEDAHGWTIISAAESAITMTFNRTLQLFFTPASFKSNNSSAESENSSISLTYIADAHEYHSLPLTTEKRFFLQIMRAQLQCLQQSRTKVKDLLTFVSTGWEFASTIAEQARVLGVSYITDPTITSDEVMAIRSLILLSAMKTKVEVVFEVKVRSGDGVASLAVGVKSTAKVCYGEGLKEKKMGDFLESKIARKGKGGKERGVWAKAVGELEERLVARGKKL